MTHQYLERCCGAFCGQNDANLLTIRVYTIELLMVFCKNYINLLTIPVYMIELSIDLRNFAYRNYRNISIIYIRLMIFNKYEYKYTFVDVYQIHTAYFASTSR